MIIHIYKSFKEKILDGWFLTEPKEPGINVKIYNVDLFIEFTTCKDKTIVDLSWVKRGDKIAYIDSITVVEGSTITLEKCTYLDFTLK